MEKWVDIKGFEGIYQVSSYGRVKRLSGIITRSDGVTKRVKESMLKQRKSEHYCSVQLCVNGKPKSFHTHRLVASAFIENPQNFPVVHHIDSNPENNNVENLMWCTYSYNNKYSYDYEGHKRVYKGVKGADMPMARAMDMYDLCGVYIRSFGCIKDAAIYLGVKGRSASNISACARGKKTSAFGYLWTFQGEDIEPVLKNYNKKVLKH